MTAGTPIVQYLHPAVPLIALPPAPSSHLQCSISVLSGRRSPNSDTHHDPQDGENRTRLSVDIATHCPRPLRAGEEAEGRAGWGLSIEPYAIETGEEDAPPPRQPHPQWRYPHGPLDGKMLKSVVCAPGHGFSTGYRHNCPRPSWAGEEREARAGWGLQITACVAETEERATDRALRDRGRSAGYGKRQTPPVM
jgi:hypothetical protein